MEIASFQRFVKLVAFNKSEINKTLLFFTPCEELAGGSIFSLLSFNINIIQPYIDKVDQSFIEFMNSKIKNTIYYS